jgi:hypothetical protein
VTTSPARDSNNDARAGCGSSATGRSGSGEDRGAIVELEDPESVGHSKILRIVTANASRPVGRIETMTGIGRPRIVSGCARA